MTLDSSVLIAILFSEPNYLDLVDRILEADHVRVGAPTLVEAGMVFAADVLNSQGQTLIPKGQEVTETLRTRLVNLSSKVRGPPAVSWLRKERSETQTLRV